MDPYYHNPYTEQFNIGYSFQFSNADVIEVDYIHSLGLRESKTLDINPKVPALGGARVLDAAFTKAGLPTLGRIDVESAVGRSRYDGLNIAYRRRMSRHFSMNSSYVLSRALAYTARPRHFAIARLMNYNYFAPFSFGPTPSDSTHRGVISAIVDLPWGVTFATTLQLESGRPYNPNQGIDVTGQGESSTTRHAIVPKDQPTNFTAFATASARTLRACLAAKPATLRL